MNNVITRKRAAVLVGTATTFAGVLGVLSLVAADADGSSDKAPPAVSAQVINALASASTIVKPTSGAGFPIPISADKATLVAAAGLGRFGAGETPDQASLALVTEPLYGAELEPDPAKPSQISPVVKDRLSWVFVFNNVQVPVMGGPLIASDGTRPKPTGDTSAESMVVVIDALTGEFLTAETF